MKIHRQVITEPATPSIGERTPLGPAPELPLYTRTPRGRRRAIIIAVLIAGLAGSLVWTKHSKKAATGRNSPPSLVTVEQRDFVHTLRLHGTVEATQSYSVLVPNLAGATMDNLIVTRLVDSGTAVRRGDLLVEFDRQAELKNFVNRQAEFRDFEEQINKKQAEQAAARAKDESELKQAENAVETASLEMQKNEIVSRIDAEKNQENLDEAKATARQLRETFELKRQAAQAELRVLEIQRDSARSAMLYAQSNADKMVIRSPVDGLAVLNLVWKEGQMAEVREGEQVRAGVPILQVVNPAAMEVHARVNQVDIPYLRVGQAVRVSLDAYPDLVFSGKLEQISPVSVASGFSQRVRHCAVIFSIQGGDPKLMPDLSAGVDVFLAQVPHALLVPREALRTENGESYVIVDSIVGAERRRVKTGAMNDTEVVIESGLEAGTVVRRSGG